MTIGRPSKPRQLSGDRYEVISPRLADVCVDLAEIECEIRDAFGQRHPLSRQAKRAEGHAQTLRFILANEASEK